MTAVKGVTAIRVRITLLLCLLAAALLGGCTDNGRFLIRMDLQDPVYNLDPQFATEDSARMILLHLGEGLMIREGETDLRLGVAQRCTVSPDGLTYEFVLREDACWEDGEPVLASHFVFAFRRMFSPGAPSPNAEDFQMLQGARAILSGQGSPDDLGVTAPDPTRVVFSLEQPSAALLERLASPAALPCREDFFVESRGRYGLEQKQVLSNGPFTLSRWDNDSSIRLQRSGAYTSPRGPAQPEQLIFYLGREDPMVQYRKGKSDLVVAGPAQRGQIKDEDALIERETRVWCLVFHQEDSVWGNPLLRQSLAHTIDPSRYPAALGEGLHAAGSLFPPSGPLGNSAEPAGPLAYDPRQGKHLLTLGLETQGLERIPITALPSPEEYRDALTLITQDWQQHLNLSLFPEPVALDRLEQRLQQGSFQVLLYPYPLEDSGPDGLLRRFLSDNRNNRSGYASPRFDQLMETARGQSDAPAALEAYAAAQAMLLQDAAVIPLFWERAAYVISPKVSGVEVTSGGTILLHHAAKSS